MFTTELKVEQPLAADGTVLPLIFNETAARQGNSQSGKLVS